MISNNPHHYIRFNVDPCDFNHFHDQINSERAQEFAQAKLKAKAEKAAGVQATRSKCREKATKMVEERQKNGEPDLHMCYTHIFTV